MEEIRTTVSRKKEHVELCINNQVAFRKKSSGFERYEFVHNALPELDFKEISTRTNFIGKNIAFPLMISSMTGGYKDAEEINKQLAEVCEVLNIPMGVGSQRQAIEKSDFHSTYSIVRKYAPSIPLTANIGATEIAALSNIEPILRIIDLIKADALTIHLNPLQELLQPEGNTDFRGVTEGIGIIIKELNIPVIIKEVGAGISDTTAKVLLELGVSVIDVAGAGGTSWAGVEILRNKNPDPMQEFWDWGISTTECLETIKPLKEKFFFTLVSSGGISNGFHIAKSIALGADLTASARPLLTTLIKEGKDGLLNTIAQWQNDVKRIMFLTGSKSVKELQNASIRRIY